MNEREELLQQLRSLIGTELRLHGDRHQVIEILPEGPTVVLQALDEEPVIQANAQGEATRRVPRIVEVQAWLGGANALDPRVKAWLAQAAKSAS